jgi:glycosyltransferase involved in cell wall biosynthesis
MKIVVFAPMAPWINGGQPRVLKEHEKRMDLEIYSTNTDENECGKFNNVTVFKAYIEAYLFSPGIFKTKKVEKVLAHGYTTFLPLIASIKGKELYFMPHYHDEASNLFFKILRKIYDPTIGSYLMHRAKKIFCVSEFEKKSIIDKFNINLKKIVVVYNGIDLKKFEKIKSYKTNKNIILYIGRLEKYKNIQFLIKAMKYLPNFELKIIGNGPYKKDLIKIANERIEFLENLSDYEVLRWYKTCSVFVTLSDIEAFGITVIEALASGKPVVVNDATSLKEFAEKFEDVKKIDIHKKSIIQVAKMIKKTSKITVKKVDLSDYDWDKICKRIENEIMR